MASKTAIGDLYVRLSADASGLEKTLDNAQKRMTGFAAKIAAPITGGMRLGGLLGGAVMGPAGVLGGAASAIGNLLDPAGASLLNPTKFSDTMREAVERTHALAREAKRLDFDPQFLRAFQAAAGPEAEAAEAGVKKFLRVIGDAKGGDKEAAAKLSKFGLGDVVNKTTTQAVEEYADKYKMLGDRASQAAMGISLMGKGASEAHNLFAQGAEGIEKFARIIRESGLYSAEEIAAAREFKAMKKLFDLKKEMMEQKAFQQGGGAFEIGGLKRSTSGLFSGQWWEGLDEQMGVALQKSMGQLWGMAPRGVPGMGGQQQIPQWWKEIQEGQAAAATTAATLTEAFTEQADAILGVEDATDRAVRKFKAMEFATEGQKAEVDKALERLRAAPLAKEFDAMSASLERQAQFFGLAADRAKVLGAQLDGLPLDKAQRALDAIDKLDRLKLADETSSPLEKAGKEFDRLNKLFGGGKMEFENAAERDLFGRGLGKLFRGVIQQGGIGDFKLAPAALKGTAEAYKLETADNLQMRNALRDPADKLAAAAEVLRKSAEKDREFEQALLNMVEQNGIGILTGGVN